MTPQTPDARAPAPPAEARPSAPQPGAPDQIGAWLDRLLRLARLPAREASELRDELDAHLRERVRDLMLAGHDEPVAIHKSISELGDLALLAQRYREASRTPTRRLIMHAAIIATAAAALGLSTVAIQQAQPEPEAGIKLELRPQLGARADSGAPYLSTVPVLSHYFGADARPTESVTDDVELAPLSEVLAMLAESQDLRPYIHWRDIEATPDTEIADLPLAGQQLGRALDMINDALNLDGQITLEYRALDGLFEVASRDYFDRRERELVTYDVADLVYADGPLEITAESQVLAQLIIEIVEPEGWPENGGNTASLAAVGGRLFVNAPPRVHERVAWLLAQLQDEQAHSADDARVVTSYELANTAAGELLPILDDAVRALGGQAQLNARTNSLLVVGTDEAQAVARTVVNALDRPAAEPQPLASPDAGSDSRQ